MLRLGNKLKYHNLLDQLPQSHDCNNYVGMTIGLFLQYLKLRL